jgi:hypothetical protein
MVDSLATLEIRVKVAIGVLIQMGLLLVRMFPLLIRKD